MGFNALTSGSCVVCNKFIGITGDVRDGMKVVCRICGEQYAVCMDSMGNLVHPISSIPPCPNNIDCTNCDGRKYNNYMCSWSDVSTYSNFYLYKL